MVLEITKGARSLLSQYNILKNGSVYVELSKSDIRDIVEAQHDSIVSLIKGVEKIGVVAATLDVPLGCALNAISPEVTVHVLVKGQVDLDAEIAKVNKKLSAAQEFQKKNNELISKFNERTNEAAKEAAFKRQESYKAEIEGYEQTIAILENLKL